MTSAPPTPPKRPRQSFTKVVGVPIGTGFGRAASVRVLDPCPYDRIVSILNFSNGQYGLSRSQATGAASAFVSLGGLTNLTNVRIPRGNELWFANSGGSLITATFIVTELPEGA